MHTITDHRAAAPTAAGDAVGTRRLRALVAAAVGLCTVAAVAGLSVLVLDPAPGSGLEGALGLVAAVSGLGTGALAIASVIYAQSRNLWRFAAGWVRWVVMGVVVVAIVRSILDALGATG